MVRNTVFGRVLLSLVVFHLCLSTGITEASPAGQASLTRRELARTPEDMCARLRVDQNSTCAEEGEDSELIPALEGLVDLLRLLGVNSSTQCQTWMGQFRGQNRSLEQLSADLWPVLGPRVVVDVFASCDVVERAVMATNASQMAQSTSGSGEASSGNGPVASQQTWNDALDSCRSARPLLLAANRTLNGSAPVQSRLQLISSLRPKLGRLLESLDISCDREIGGITARLSFCQPANRSNSAYFGAFGASAHSLRSFITGLSRLHEFAFLTASLTELELEGGYQYLQPVDFAGQACQILFPPCIRNNRTGAVIGHGHFCPGSCETLDERLYLLHSLIGPALEVDGFEILQAVSDSCYHRTEFAAIFDPSHTDSEPPCCISSTAGQQPDGRIPVAHLSLLTRQAWQNATGRRGNCKLPGCPTPLQETVNDNHWQMTLLSEFDHFIQSITGIWPEAVGRNLSGVAQCGLDCRIYGFRRSSLRQGRYFVGVLSWIFVAVFLIAVVCFIKYWQEVRKFPLRLLIVYNIYVLIGNVTVYIPGTLVNVTSLICFEDGTLATGWASVSLLCQAETWLFFISMFGGIVIWLGTTHAIANTLRDITTIAAEPDRTFKPWMEMAYVIASLVLPSIVSLLAYTESEAQAFPLYGICAVPSEQWIYFVTIPSSILAVIGTVHLVRCIVHLKHIISLSKNAPKSESALQELQNVKRHRRLSRISNFIMIYVISSAFCHIATITSGIILKLAIAHWKTKTERYLRCAIATCQPDLRCGQEPFLPSSLVFVAVGAILINGIISLSWILIIKRLVEDTRQSMRQSVRQMRNSVSGAHTALKHMVQNTFRGRRGSKAAPAVHDIDAHVCVNSSASALEMSATDRGPKRRVTFLPPLRDSTTMITPEDLDADPTAGRSLAELGADQTTPRVDLQIDLEPGTDSNTAQPPVTTRGSRSPRVARKHATHAAPNPDQLSSKPNLARPLSMPPERISSTSLSDPFSQLRDDIISLRREQKVSAPT